MSISINDYHHTREVIYNGVYREATPGACYFGVEIECESAGDNDSCWNTDELERNLIGCKFIPLFDPTEDGSLDNGVEFVSQPMQLSAWMKIKNRIMEPAFSALIEVGMRGHESQHAGLHIHVSRDFFHKGNMDARFWEIIGNMFILMEQNWFSFCSFARRPMSDYAKRIMSSSDTRTILKEKLKETEFRSRAQGDRYRAINLEKRATIEFRMFKGTLNIETFYATLQFVSNFCMLAKHGNREDILEMDIMDVINFKQYPELASYAAKRNLAINKNITRDTSKGEE